MKLDTIANRGSRRDFVDLYVAAQAFGIREIFVWFENKYSSLSYNRTHLFKALTYFGDAERDPLPDMRAPLEWDAVKRFFAAEVPRLTRLS